MAWTGSCNHCGHCGCDGNSPWSPGIPLSILDWASDHQDPDYNKFAVYIVGRIGYTKGDRGAFRINIPGLGRVDFWISDEGIQKSETDTGCPFFETGTPGVCLIWSEDFLPPSCANTPQIKIMNTEQAQQWMTNHSPTCGWSWV